MLVKRFLVRAGLCLLLFIATAGVVAGAYGYLLVTDTQRAVLAKIYVQNYFNRRDVTDELLWFVIGEFGELQISFQTCDLKPARQ